MGSCARMYVSGESGMKAFIAVLVAPSLLIVRSEAVGARWSIRVKSHSTVDGVLGA